MNDRRTLSHFVWHDCLTPDIDKALNYFEKLVNWDVQDQTWPNIGRYPIIQRNDRPIAGILELPKFLKDSGVPSYWTGYVETSIKAAEESIPKLRGQMFTMPTKSSMGTSFVFTDTGGAVLAAYELSDSFNIPSSSSLDEFVWRRLYSVDNERSYQFYNALFGWKQSGEFANELIDESGALIADMAGPPSWLESDTWVYFLGIEDLAATVSTIEKYGGSVIEDTKVHNRRAIVSKDSQGAVIGFVQWE